ncbi:MAG TPA: peptidoglycan-binding domain-containing protein [Terriglobales bacterium]|nr:peptidoglycan-binding domain-containing protein [Terriglobales bacterium]
MRGNGPRRILATFSALLLLTAVAAAKTTNTSHKQVAAAHKSAHRSAKHVTSRRSRHSRSRHSRMAWKYRGQKRPDAERTREIQEALARQNYLHGTPSGVWDQNTRAAMARFQEDHGWQTKMVPDARALIALGLGPSNNGLINPETAMTSAPLAAGVGAADRDLPSSGAPFRQ